MAVVYTETAFISPSKITNCVGFGSEGGKSGRGKKTSRLSAMTGTSTEIHGHVGKGAGQTERRKEGEDSLSFTGETVRMETESQILYVCTGWTKRYPNSVTANQLFV